MPGEQNIADSLSRLLQAENQAGPLAVLKVSAEDEEFSELHHCIKSGTWKDGQLKQYVSVASKLCDWQANHP